MNAELKGHGISNLISGITGGVPNYLCYSSSVTYFKCNGGSKYVRVRGVSVLGVVGVVLYSTSKHSYLFHLNVIYMLFYIYHTLQFSIIMIEFVLHIVNPNSIVSRYFLFFPYIIILYCIPYLHLHNHSLLCIDIFKFFYLFIFKSWWVSIGSSDWIIFLYRTVCRLEVLLLLVCYEYYASLNVILTLPLLHIKLLLYCITIHSTA